MTNREKSFRSNRIAVCCLALCLIASVRARAFEAGAAKVEITPPLETPLNGYGDRQGRGAIAVHDPVWARSLFISDGTTSVLLVNTDLCVINRELRDAVLKLAPAEVPKENIFLTATHTHSAQGGMSHLLVYRTVSGRFMPEVLESTAQKIAESMQSALASRKRATIGFDVTSQDNLTENRRVPGGPVDPQIGVIRVDDSDGNTIAIIGNMAAHPTTVEGADKFSISADYPGVFYNAIEAQSAPGCVAMFLNGAEGNQRPANPEKLSGWAHTEWVGNQLAAKVMEVASKITGVEAQLHVQRSTPELPRTIASSFVPATTDLATLEVDDLLLTFVPGEPCVEIGLELRRMAQARGYKAQLTVGLANDHLLYFVPRELYSTPSYECGMNMYGPAIDRWLYREFDALMSKGKPATSKPPAPESAAKIDIENGTGLKVQGSRYAIGYQRGAALADQLKEAYANKIVSRCEDGSWIPSSGMWTYAPSFLDLTPVALWRLSIGARPMLATLSNETLDTLEGIADGAGLPFDAVWLMQCAPTIAAGESIEALYQSPFCTMVAITGERAGSDQVLVGRNFDWIDAENPVVVDADPENGMRYVQVGFSWTAGAYTGMNEAGLAVAIERVESAGLPALNGPPIDMIMQEALMRDRSVAEVLTRLETVPHLRGYHVLIADAIPENARVVELGESRVTRVPSSGILLGANFPPTSVTDADYRYRRIDTLLRAKRSFESDALARIMSDKEPGRAAQQTILNAQTRHSVVMEPRFKRIHLAFPDENGKLGTPLTISLRKTTP
ncbi:MAG: neutral/alkaline non-lysosomal ceramidase N-terminal domain-containing protein [Candidatus Hydrogenedentes bacterium]|nr:neutral/alkaline non-lysosomal ceramidase N-terminal domain-containing protein [Candidatus Hydrogenedentota bacterium]